MNENKFPKGAILITLGILVGCIIIALSIRAGFRLLAYKLAVATL